MVYEIYHDMGEVQNTFAGTDSENEEPVQPGKDTIASLSAKIGNERPV